MLPSYTVAQYRPSLVAYTVLETITELLYHDVGGQGSVAPPSELDETDIKLCMTDVSNFLQSTASRILYPTAVFY